MARSIETRVDKLEDLVERQEIELIRRVVKTLPLATLEALAGPGLSMLNDDELEAIANGAKPPAWAVDHAAMRYQIPQWALAEALAAMAEVTA